jgi:hypothetical protein
MNKKLVYIVAILSIIFVMVTCTKQESISTNEEQPITVSLEIDGKQSHEVRIK